MVGGQFNHEEDSIRAELWFWCFEIFFFLYEQYSLFPQTENASLFAINFFRMYIQKMNLIFHD